MAVTHEGRVINSALPIIYDSERTITIMGEDDEQELKGINGQDDEGLGRGNFDVTVSVGPSSNNQREEQAAGMLEMLNQVPMVQNVAADLVVRSQDWVGKDALADRLEFGVEMGAPGITTQVKPEEGENDELSMLQQQLQQAQQQMQQMQEMTAQLQQQLEKANADKQAAAAGQAQALLAELEIKKQELQLKAQEIQGNLAIKKQELELKGMTADMEAETTLKVNSDKLQVELIKDESQKMRERQAQLEDVKLEQQKVNATVFDAVTRRMGTEQTHMDAKQQAKQITENKEKTVTKILSPKKKKSTITKDGDGKYNVETIES